MENTISQVNFRSRRTASQNNLRRWSFDLQTNEAVDQCIVGTRAMYGWRPHRIGMSKRTHLVREHPYTRLWLIAACVLCTGVFLGWFVKTAIKGLSPSATLILGFASVIILYEAWILIKRVLRHRAR